LTSEALMPLAMRVNWARGQEPAPMMARLGTNWRKAGFDIGEQAAQFMSTRAIGYVPVNFGRLKKSITIHVGFQGDSASAAVLAEVYSDLAYAETMELGRRPGKRPPPTAPVML